MKHPYLIEIRLMGETKHITRKLIYDIYHKFHVKGAVKNRPVPHVSLFGPFRCKSIRPVLQCIREIGSDYSKLDYDVDGFDYFESKKKFLFITTSTRKNVIFLKINPSEDLREFRYKLAKKLLEITNTSNFDIDSNPKFHFHATLAMKDIDRKFDGVWDYLKKYDIRVMGFCLRITLIKEGKIMYEFDLSTQRLLNRRQALGPRFKKTGNHPPVKLNTMSGSDETQFWVCPNCGDNPQTKEGRQFCPSCKTYI